MTPEIGLIIAQSLLKYGPGIAQEIAIIFSKPEHTIDDWLAVFDKVKSYEQLDAESKARVAPAV